MKATEAAPGCIPKLWVVSPSLRSEGGEGRGEEGRQLCQASPLPNPLPVRLAALARERSGRGEGERRLRTSAQPTTSGCTEAKGRLLASHRGASEDAINSSRSAMLAGERPAASPSGISD